MTVPTLQDGDSRLVKASAAGDRQAFGQLFELYSGRVFATAYQFTQSRSAAADVTQEVFLRLLSRIGQYRGDSAFTSWLHRIVANAAIDFTRASSRFDALDGHHPSVTIVAPPQAAACERRDREWRVRTALARLSPRLRVAMTLRYVDGLSYERIAVVLKISPGTVASRLARGHVKLARELEKLGVER